MGGALGAGGGFSFSNAGSPSDLAGHARTWSTTLGPYNFSLSFGENGIYTLQTGMGKGLGLDVSVYDTSTSILYRTGC